MCSKMAGDLGLTQKFKNIFFSKIFQRKISRLLLFMKIQNHINLIIINTQLQ